MSIRHANSGTALKSNGEVHNWVDHLSLKERYSLLDQTIDNGAARIAGRHRGIDQDVYYIGLSVPAGRRIVIFDRILKLTENQYDVDVVTAADGFTGGGSGEVVTSTLASGATPTVTSTLTMNVTPTGAITVRDLDIVDTGTNVGSGRAGGASSVEGVILTIEGKSMIRITRQAGGTPYTALIRILVWEEDAP